jgi:hypothetical protein
MRFRETEVSRQPLLRRKVVEQYPTFSGEVICCLAGIPGESRDSGHGLGLDGRAKLGVSSPDHEQFPGQSREGLPDSRTGLILGDFFLNFEDRSLVRTAISSTIRGC